MELDGNEQYWTRRAQIPPNGLDRSGLSRTAVQKTELDGTALHWTGLS